ncbi:hypothetical protein [Uliginosibacterium sp. 31-12]|uniref:hypothetical protein n=1 Tax=Uliginosibacterium sp. 31-12 TaxID=3062781 RepID=UPI0026E3FC27|nr:hypothetical protein [Uliginosibacterium sp. 31-12]MDO6388449.1 hypothetical protein [Uliginosibacterium sp. 31-12]
MNGHDVTLQRQGVTAIEVADWLELKKTLHVQIANGFIYPESEENERSAVRKFRETLHSRFSSLGVPAVKIAVESGEFASGIMKLEATEWLLRQDHEYNAEVLAIAREANAIANEAKLASAASAEAAVAQAKWAKWAAVIAMVAAIVSAKDSINEFLGRVL